MWCPSQVNRLILGKLLQSFGFDVFYSKDGQEAYEFYKEQGTDISCVWMVRLCQACLASTPYCLFICSYERVRSGAQALWGLHRKIAISPSAQLPYILLKMRALDSYPLIMW